MEAKRDVKNGEELVFPYPSTFDPVESAMGIVDDSTAASAVGEEETTEETG